MSATAQPRVLPSAQPCLNKGFGYAGLCQNLHAHGGGDYYDVLPLDQNSLMLVVADVMGKGEEAAFFAASLRTLVRAVVWPGSDPADCLAQVNQLMFDQLSSADTFITAQLAVANLEHRELVVANAGHCPLLVSDGKHLSHAIAPEGMPLGIEPDGRYQSQCVVLEPHSSVLMYTDGVTEAQDLDGKLFGQARLERWFRRSVAAGQTASELKEGLLRTLANFQGGNEATDDRTFLLLSDERPDSAGVLPRQTRRWSMPWRRPISSSNVPITVVS